MKQRQRKVLITDPLSAAGVSLLEGAAGIEVEVAPRLESEQLLARLPGVDALIVRGGTRVDAQLIASACSLRLIGRAGIGVDNIDVDAATSRGVVVVNAPQGSSIATAEHAMGLMIALARKIPQAHSSVRQGKWLRSAFTGSELRGKTLGIVGLGNIGSVVAELGAAWGMRVIAHDPGVDPKRAEQVSARLVPLDELYGNADFVSIHVPLTPQTRKLVDGPALSKMKRGAMIINCARGGIVDEDGLVEALASGQLGGAALDVFSSEPPPADHPLLAFDNVIVTPHLGSRTVEAQVRLAVEIAREVVTFLQGGKVSYAVNVPPLSGALSEGRTEADRQ